VVAKQSNIGAAAAARVNSGAPAADLLCGLPPIVDAGVDTLILGSFPSPASLAAGGYYAHPQNQFWRLLAELTDEPALLAADREGRDRLLLANGIGVWDLYRHCRREGALDAAIEAGERNDFPALLAGAPRLRRVFFNGRTAARGERWFCERGFTTAVLPSSSPALTLAFALKLERWRAAWSADAAG
jgi:hypoxanthine-DNA glycosylase